MFSTCLPFRELFRKRKDSARWKFAPVCLGEWFSKKENITSCGFERYQSPLIVTFSTVSSKETDRARNDRLERKNHSLWKFQYLVWKEEKLMNGAFIHVFTSAHFVLRELWCNVNASRYLVKLFSNEYNRACVLETILTANIIALVYLLIGRISRIKFQKSKRIEGNCSIRKVFVFDEWSTKKKNFLVHSMDQSVKI